MEEIQQNLLDLEDVCQKFIHEIHTAIQSGENTPLDDCRTATSGEMIIYERLMDGMRYTVVCSSENDQILSMRQLEILNLMCQGLTNKQIAYHLEISPSTVDTYVRRLFEKLRVNSRVEVVALAFRKRLVSGLQKA